MLHASPSSLMCVINCKLLLSTWLIPSHMILGSRPLSISMILVSVDTWYYHLVWISSFLVSSLWRRVISRVSFEDLPIVCICFIIYTLYTCKPTSSPSRLLMFFNCTYNTLVNILLDIISTQNCMMFTTWCKISTPESKMYLPQCSLNFGCHFISENLLYK